MSTTCLYSDIVLPTATWYEKNDLNTSDMHPSSIRCRPRWTRPGRPERLGDLQGLREEVQRAGPGHLGVEKEVVLTPLMHDSPAELAQPFGVSGLEARRVRTDSRQDRAADRGGRARLPERVQALHGAGPADEQGRQRRQGHRLEHPDEVEQLGQLNGQVTDAGVTQGMPKIDTDIDACEVMLQLAPETNGHVAVKAWEALSKPPAASTRTWRCTGRTRRSASATCRRSRARSSRRPPGAAWRARRSRTTPATPTCTS